MVPIPKLDAPVHSVMAYSPPTCCTHSKTCLKFVPEAYWYAPDMVVTCRNVLYMAKPKTKLNKKRKRKNKTERVRTGTRPTPLSFP